MRAAPPYHQTSQLRRRAVRRCRTGGPYGRLRCYLYGTLPWYLTHSGTSGRSTSVASAGNRSEQASLGGRAAQAGVAASQPLVAIGMSGEQIFITLGLCAHLSQPSHDDERHVVLNCHQITQYGGLRIV